MSVAALRSEIHVSMKSTLTTRSPSQGKTADIRNGLLLGLVGVVCFSLTLPATRVAVPQLGPVVVGFGRAIPAAVLAAALLAFRREPFPKSHALAIAATGLGVVVGFPLFTALALQFVPAIHAAVVIGFLPAATAIFAAVRGSERPSVAFWCGSAVGLVTIIAFAEILGAGGLRAADVFLLLAVLCSGYGYAEGGRISRELSGWRVICWGLVLTAPLLLLPVALAIARSGLHSNAAGWAGFTYVSVVSMLLGFFAWYAGLSLGGIARVGQIQLIQLPLTVLWSALFLHERVTIVTVAAASLVVASAFAVVQLRVARRGGNQVT